MIDGPPVLGLADASLLASHANAVLHVVRLARVRRREVEASLEQLRGIGAGPAGVVLNGLQELPAYYPTYGAPTPPAP